MTHQIYSDLVAKRVTDDNGTVYWLLFRSGEIAHPELVLPDAAARAFARVVVEAEAGKGEDRPF